jgi:thiamine-monophosphate kinase
MVIRARLSRKGKLSYNLLMKVTELGEFSLIELLSRVVSRGKPTEGQLLVGIGDDAAAWGEGNSVTLATTDTLAEGVHFNLENTTWRELGWKVIAINLSDIAAMGGAPLYGMVSLALPSDTEVDWVTQLYQGMADIIQQFDMDIVGGNVSEASSVVITASVIGRGKTPLLTRSAALPGEVVAVTGHLGSAAAGLHMLTHRLQLNEKSANLIKEAQLHPYPRVAEGQTLLKLGVRAAIDISDGLLSDLIQLCKMSGVGAQVRIDSLPIHPLVRAAFKDKCLDFALSGGEDYELLFTAPAQLINDIKKEMKCPVTVVGEIVNDEPGQVTLLGEGGRIIEGKNRKGWQHFHGRQ